MKQLLILLLIFNLNACSPAGGNIETNYAELDPETYASLMPYVREYYYYRKQAVIQGDINLLYDHYPALEKDVDAETGINTEIHHVTSMQSLAPIEGNISLEYYEKIKIKESEGEIEILVHGMELYLWKDADSGFNESGGEFKMVLYFKQSGDSWEIYKTDEVTLSEWKGVGDQK